jgi:membrane-bound metal-dependent hydrolase YbcI (DUF457 family)
MPTPLAHGVAGLAAMRTVRGTSATPIRLALAAFVIAQLPDLDFVPGLLVHNVGTYHRGATHSLVGAVLASLVIAALLRRVWPWLCARRDAASPSLPGFWLCYALVLPVYLSHVALDLVSLDVVDNSGLVLWWPFTHAYVSAPLPLPAALTNFFDLEFGPTSAEFFRTFFSLRALGVFVVEALLFSPLLLLPMLARRLRRRRPHGSRAKPEQRTLLDLERGAEA